MSKMKVMALCLALSFVLIGGPIAQGQTAKGPAKAKKASPQAAAEEAFKKAFPQIKLESMKPIQIQGLYEVIINGSEIAYFDPKTGSIILGDIIEKGGKNVTEQRKGELTAAKVKDLPLDKAVKVGSGKHTVIEFTDPDCPYCRRASVFLAEKKDLATRYIFFFPLPMHPDAENKIKYIFCAEDKAKAYEEAMSGKLDDKKYEQCNKPEAALLLNQHKEIGKKMGITGTPFFVIDGKKSIVGANTPEIEAALKGPAEN